MGPNHQSPTQIWSAHKTQLIELWSRQATKATSLLQSREQEYHATVGNDQQKWAIEE